jgi:hypothetical protein
MFNQIRESLPALLKDAFTLKKLEMSFRKSSSTQDRKLRKICVELLKARPKRSMRCSHKPTKRWIITKRKKNQVLKVEAPQRSREELLVQ